MRALGTGAYLTRLLAIISAISVLRGCAIDVNPMLHMALTPAGSFHRLLDWSYRGLSRQSCPLFANSPLAPETVQPGQSKRGGSAAPFLGILASSEGHLQLQLGRAAVLAADAVKAEPSIHRGQPIAGRTGQVQRQT